MIFTDTKVYYQYMYIIYDFSLHRKYGEEICQQVRFLIPNQVFQSHPKDI